MIREYIGFEQNGLYSNIYSIVTLINIPQMGLYNISAPMINKHLTENTLQELDRFHKKTSLSLFFLGLVFFSCIMVGFPFLTDFMKNGKLLRTAEPILWIIGITMLFDLATGFNSHIISISRFYKYNTLFMLINSFQRRFFFLDKFLEIQVVIKLLLWKKIFKFINCFS